MGLRKLHLFLAILSFSACATSMSKTETPALPTVNHVDLQRYVGRWYVIANIPPSVEKDAYNSVEEYRIDEDGNIPTVFTFRKGGFDGKLKTLESKGFVKNTQTNAEWGVRFIWPIKAEYLIAWLAEDYSQVIVARSKRDYVWIMARTPTISDRDYSALQGRVAAMGYDTSLLNRVPQRWPDPGR